MEYGKKNGDPEEIYPNNNISTKENDRQQRRRPQFSITETYIKTGGKKILYRANKHMSKPQATFEKP